jgi:hypothetical protein
VSKLTLIVIAAMLVFSAIGAGWKWQSMSRGHAAQEYRIAGWTWDAPVAVEAE